MTTSPDGHQPAPTTGHASALVHPHEEGGHGHEHGGHHDHAHHDDHDHHHDHGGLRGLVRSIVAPHSHDPADAVDEELQGSADGIRAVKVSLVVLALTALAQLAVVLASGSVALLADTIHNASDAFTAVPLWVAFALSRRSPSRRFTYGYGRAEDLAGLVVVVMIALSAVVAGIEAVRRLLDPAPVDHLAWVAVAGAVGFVGNEAVAWYRTRVGRRIGSAALVADGLHARADGFTSLAVLVGAGGVALGFPLADPLVGLVITVAILAVLRTAARDVLSRLLDGVDPTLVTRAEEVLRDEPGVLAVRSLRMRWIGHRLHADAELDVDGTATTLEGAHALAHRAENHLTAAVPRLGSVLVHAYPAHTHPAERADLD